MLTYHITRSDSLIASSQHLVIEGLNWTFNSCVVLETVLGGFKRTSFLDLCHFYPEAPGKVASHCQHIQLDWSSSTTHIHVNWQRFCNLYLHSLSSDLLAITLVRHMRGNKRNLLSFLIKSYRKRPFWRLW